jgi:hypothetical protein
MTSTSCAFILTKLSDLSLYHFPFFPYTYVCAIIYNLVKDGYHEVFGYCEGLDSDDA